MGRGQSVAKLKMGLIGGGEGAFIGAVHRMAAELDGEIQVICGALSSDPERARRSGTERFGLAPERSYGSVDEMLRVEANRPVHERMDFVAIATPNHTHFPIAQAALRAGFAVVCDKPLCTSMEDAKALRRQIQATGKLFAVTHNYSGYPMVKEARQRIRNGEIGTIRRIQVEYLQGWLSQPIERGGQKQAVWRTDPQRSGAAGCVGDIGSHAQHLAEYVSGLRIESLAADISCSVPGRLLDDDANVLLRFNTGAKGVLAASQVAAGEENALRLKIFGENGGFEWAQQEPDTLLLKHPNKPIEVLRRGGPGLANVTAQASRIPSGHPEAFLEAFANLYRAVAAQLSGRPSELDYPTIDDAVHSMAFITAVVQSSEQNARWINLKPLEA